ncbi:hypothetical protein B7Y92_03095 [Candidatus Saccharibacteria bacterium 32-50-13]|nr:MAG: hypothetical protein B7Y92_03095 [Candidatus Saccharibacteria bacterium 32-50-13]
MKYWSSFVVLAIALAWFGLTNGAFAQAIPPAPADIPVVDLTNTLSTEQKQSLADKIAREREVSGNQIAILMIDSLDGWSVEDYGLAVARQWGIGTGENNNGVLLLVAMEDRRSRIEVGYGLEGALTDATAGRILRNELTPHFRDEDYYEGLSAALDSIIASINGEYVAAESLDVPIDAIGNLAFFGLAGLIWLSSIMARSKSWWLGGVIGGIGGFVGGLFTGNVWAMIGLGAGLALLGALFDRAISKNYLEHRQKGDKPSWWAGGTGFGGRSGGSGGFGGFGGGGFGGGGASGGW